MPAAGYGAALDALRAGPTAGAAPLVVDARSLTLFVLGFELLDGSLDDLERVGRDVTDERLARIFSTSPDLAELLALRTCQRVELYGVATRELAPERLRARLPSPERWTVREEEAAVAHLLRVAAGLESVAVGEKEVRAQIDQASRSVRSRHPRAVLKRLFARARTTADTCTPEPSPARSIAALAASKVLEMCGDPFPRVLVVGAGTVGRQVAEHLAPRARITLVYRHHPPESTFLRDFGLRAVPARQLAEEIALCDAIVTAAKTAGRLLRPADFDRPGARGRPRLVIDLGVPRNVDPAAGRVPGVQLVDLSGLGSSPRSRAGIDPLAERLDREVRPVYREFLREALEPWVTGLFQRGEAVRQRELGAARPHLGDLNPEQLRAVDLLTLRITRQLLLPAARQLRAVEGGPHADRLRRTALELFSPDPPPP
jgi:glutamyl-tRNA reductase